jgi:hypothetical protein
MNMSHILVLVSALLVGVVFASTLRGLPLISSLPQY